MNGQEEDVEHEQALTIKAPERYLLNEMSEPERFAFEEHYFECEACAEDIRRGELLALGVKTIGREMPMRSEIGVAVRKRGAWDWLLRPAHFAPVAGMAAFAFIAGYQALVVIPSLRMVSQPQVVETAVLHATARGEEPVIQVDGKASATILLLDVNSGEPGQALQWELQAPGGQSAGSGTTRVPPAGTQLPLLTPNAQLKHPGIWTLVLRTSGGVECGRYPFRIESK